MEKRILIQYENNHYITQYEKNCFFLNVQHLIFSTITFQFLFHFRCRRRLLFNGVLFAQEIQKELILLFMDYDVGHRLENVIIITVKLRERI